MPITSTFNPNTYITSVEQILTEWLRDFYASGTYIVTFEPPSAPAKPTIWMQQLPTDNREAFTRRGGETIQGKQMRYAVSMLSTNRATAASMAETFERHAVLASASALGAAGFRYAESTAFQDIIEPSQTKSYRRVGVLTFTIQLEKNA